MGRKPGDPDIVREDRLNLPITKREGLACRTMAAARKQSLGDLLRVLSINEILAEYAKLEPLVLETHREIKREEKELARAAAESAREQEAEEDRTAPLTAPVPGDF